MAALFFRLRSPGLACAEIVMLWFAIVATSIEFWKAVPAAGWLLLPYLVWLAMRYVRRDRAGQVVNR